MFRSRADAIVGRKKTRGDNTSVGDKAITGSGEWNMKRVLVALLGLTAMIGAASAQDAGWKPTRNVEIVIGNGAGGELDRIARAIQRAAQVDHLSSANINVINKPGTGQMVGVAYMNDHPGDAHYFAILNKSWLATMASRNTPAYTDVTPIAGLYSANSIFAVNAASPIKNAKDLLDRMGQNIDSVSFAFVARGGVEQASIVHLAMLAKADPKKLKILIFDNASKAALAVAGGHVDVYISSVGSALPLIQAGKLRAIGVAGPHRLSGDMASVPTFREQGVDIISQQAYFVVGPKGLTPAQVSYWENVLNKAVQTQGVQTEAKRESWVADFIDHSRMPAWLVQNYNELRSAQLAAGYAN
jgi:putative tricarboxylic transport membrane protein